MRRKVVELLVILLLIGGSIAVLSLVDSADATRPVPLPLVADVSAAEVQLRYEKALSILNDTTVNDVSSVPCMLESCAEAGHAQATLLLLDVYEGKRKGIEADMRKAADWANRIAIHSPNRALAAEARFRLACYEERRGTRQSLKEAFDNMRRAAEMGSPKAQAELARYLMRGIGTARNPQAAIRVLKKLAKENPEAPNLFFYAGYMYMKGLGIYGGPDYKRLFSSTTKDACCMMHVLPTTLVSCMNEAWEWLQTLPRLSTTTALPRSLVVARLPPICSAWLFASKSLPSAHGSRGSHALPCVCCRSCRLLPGCANT